MLRSASFSPDGKKAHRDRITGQDCENLGFERTSDRHPLWSINEIEILLLDVVTNNLSAKQLYLSLGFQICRIEKMAYKFNHQYCDVEIMSLQIKSLHS
ncbi:GNAT family N-acetyltransferase [Scytonema hofmannii]|uniref:GNAT family N-acetyltransferase n=1 Tax=Scytonema hofmannii TaxID=34078 RepID=UPI0003487ADD|nr:GNAT family N-acetyltransferase [Scytonema hofmannii]